MVLIHDTRNCIICNKQYISKRYNQKTCSPYCSLQRNRNNQKHDAKMKTPKRYISHYVHKVPEPKQPVPCLICYKDFIPRHNLIRTCGIECSRIYDTNRHRLTKKTTLYISRLNQNKLAGDSDGARYGWRA